MIGLHFAPDALRARRLDALMHDDLAARLGRLDGDARPPYRAGAFRTVLEGLKTGARFAPEAFALHEDFTEAFSGQRFDQAYERLASFSLARPWRGGVVVAGANGNVDAAVALIERALPELAGELRGLVREIRVADVSPRRPWGAVAVNAEASPLTVVEQLARETAGQVLAGLRVRGLRATTSDLDALHAAFVAARVHWAMSRLADSGVLKAAERTQARAAARAQEAAFEAVVFSAELSGVALTFLRSAKAYMDRPMELKRAA